MLNPVNANQRTMFLKMFPKMLRACLAMLVFTSLMNVRSAWTQEPEERDLEYWVGQLSSDHYLRRESAQQKLIRAGDEAVGPLENVLATADLETTELAIRALGEISMAQKPNDDSGAWAALDRISTKRAGSKANRAKIALEEVNSYRSETAIEAIRGAGVTIGVDEFVIQAISESNIILQINSSWRGDIDVLDWLRWVRKVQFARIEGPAVNREVLKRLAKMPDLHSITLVDGTIDVETIKSLQAITSITALELRYTHLDEKLADAITELPLRSSLSMIGTDLAMSKVEAMREKLPGLKIEYKQGGYLGVGGSDFGNVCEINRVLFGSAADKAGLKVGDRIERIGDTEIKLFSDLQAKVSQHQEGDSLTIEYSRQGNKAKVTVVLGKQIE